MRPELIQLIKQKIDHIEANPMGEFESGFAFGLRHILQLAQFHDQLDEPSPAAPGCEIISLHEARKKRLALRAAQVEQAHLS